MLALFKNLKSVATITAVLAVSASAYAITAGSDEDMLTDPEKIYTEGLPNTTFDRSYSHLPDGFDSWDYKSTDDGFHYEAGASARLNVDFSNKYVNTSGEQDITVMDVNLGVEGGIGLGCNGLDMGLEALFQFDAGELLEYLPQYIMTKFAVEALAQIYATPLVSTVMDGLKSMQSAIAEFKQASCDMNQVMDRANEIKGANYNECLDEVNKNGGTKDGKPAEAYCSDPTGLQKTIENAKLKFENMSPMSDALAAVFPESLGDEVGGDYSDVPTYEKDPVTGKFVAKDANGNAIDPQGRMPSKGRLMAMFIPDIKFSSNSKSKSDAKMAASPQLTVTNTYERARITSRNFILEMYSDMFKSLRKKKITFSEEREQALEYYDRYKDYVINQYGSKEVYEDNGDKNVNSRKPADIASISSQYKKVRFAIHETSKTLSGLQGFKIGPEYGPKGFYAISSADTDTMGAAKEALQLADICWVKTKVGTDDEYRWSKIHQDINAVFNTPASTVETLIDNVSKCTVASQVKMLTYHSYISNLQHGVKAAYLEMLAAEAAYSTTEKIIKSVNFQTMSAISTDTQKLKAFCDLKTQSGSNMSAVGKNATYDAEPNQEFKNCTDYADQMKLSEDKKEFLKSEKEKRMEELETLRDDVDKTREQYLELKELFELRNNS